mmetsp:Transcript_18729/g.43537  ORF Transcript_18729/g.43537 Transcript_18729/m.43537 type:complete len:235 (+) Transcript_18729:129-833(+)
MLLRACGLSSDSLQRCFRFVHLFLHLFNGLLLFLPSLVSLSVLGLLLTFLLLHLLLVFLSCLLRHRGCLGLLLGLFLCLFICTSLLHEFLELLLGFSQLLLALLQGLDFLGHCLGTICHVLHLFLLLLVLPVILLFQLAILLLLRCLFGLSLLLSSLFLLLNGLQGLLAIIFSALRLGQLVLVVADFVSQSVIFHLRRPLSMVVVLILHKILVIVLGCLHNWERMLPLVRARVR